MKFTNHNVEQEASIIQSACADNTVVALTCLLISQLAAHSAQLAMDISSSAREAINGVQFALCLIMLAMLYRHHRNMQANKRRISLCQALGALPPLVAGEAPLLEQQGIVQSVDQPSPGSAVLTQSDCEVLALKQNIPAHHIPDLIRLMESMANQLS